MNILVFGSYSKMMNTKKMYFFLACIRFDFLTLLKILLSVKMTGEIFTEMVHWRLLLALVTYDR